MKKQTIMTKNNQFIKLLKATQGAWGKMSEADLVREKRRIKIEKQASIKRKLAW